MLLVVNTEHIPASAFAAGCFDVCILLIETDPFLEWQVAPFQVGTKNRVGAPANNTANKPLITFTLPAIV